MNKADLFFGASAFMLYYGGYNNSLKSSLRTMPIREYEIQVQGVMFLN